MKTCLTTTLVLASFVASIEGIAFDPRGAIFGARGGSKGAKGAKGTGETGG